MAAIIPAKSAISPHVTALRVFVMPTLPKYTAKISNNTTCDVYAFVDATAISGPACVYIQ